MAVGVSLRHCGLKGTFRPLCLGAPLHAIRAIHLRCGAPEPLQLVNRMFGMAGSRSLRKLGFSERAPSAIPHCLSHRLRRSTTRYSLYATMPRRGPRGPICGVSYIDYLRLFQNLTYPVVT